MKTSIRIRCPACGMQVSQERLNQDYLPLELASFISKGRGKWIWQKNLESKGKEYLLLALKTKLKRLLAKVETLLYGYEMMAPSALATNVLPLSQRILGSYALQSSRTNVVLNKEKSSLTISSGQLVRVSS